jgi:hypothetical protein
VSLARGERPVRVAQEARSTLPAIAGPAIVIAVAPTAADRLRIADAVGDAAPVLLVASVREAVLLLARDASLVAPAREGVVITDLAETGEVADLAEARDPDDDPPGGLHIDSDARVAICGDRRTDLSPLEHDLLLSLHEADGHIRTFAWLQRHVWHNDHQGGRSHVQSVVKRLRRKLLSISSPVQIDAVRGVGLRLVGERRPGHQLG